MRRPHELAGKRVQGRVQQGIQDFHVKTRLAFGYMGWQAVKAVGIVRAGQELSLCHSAVDVSSSGQVQSRTPQNWASTFDPDPASDMLSHHLVYECFLQPKTPQCLKMFKPTLLSCDLRPALFSGRWCLCRCVHPSAQSVAEHFLHLGRELLCPVLLAPHFSHTSPLLSLFQAFI